MSVIPARLAQELRLPVVGQLMVRGVTGSARVQLYAADLEVAGISVAVQVAGLGENPLIGRDVINRWTVVLRGPEQSLEIETG